MMWPVSCAFSYPATCTLGGFEAQLEILAAEWHGWQGFPWRVTRNLHRYLGCPPVNFHYLMVHRCLAGYAAHIVLTSTFVNRRAVLKMLLRDRFEFIGVMRMFLLEAVLWEMQITHNPCILDCSGPENRHINVPTEDIELRRVTFRERMELVTDAFIGVLNLASHIDDPDERIHNHSLRFLRSGADMPPDAMLEVQAEETTDGIVLTPCRSEVVAFLRARKPLPRLLVPLHEYEGVAATQKTADQPDVDPRIPEVSTPTEPSEKPAVATPDACPAGEAALAGPLPRAKARRQQAKAGRHNAIVKDPGDRRAIRAEVKRIIGLGLSQTEACRQVADQMKQGRAGAHQLTMKFDTSAFEATMPLVRRLYLSDW